MLLNEFFGADNGCSSSVGGGAALELSEWGVDLGGIENLLDCVLVSELGVWVVDAMLVILISNLGEVLLSSSILLHMLNSGITEELRSKRHLLIVASELDVLGCHLVDGDSSVLISHLE